MPDLHSLCRDRVQQLLDGARACGDWKFSAQGDLPLPGRTAAIAHYEVWSPSLAISVCEGWLEQLRDHHPATGGVHCSAAFCVRFGNDCPVVRRIAAQLQITEED